MRTIGDIKDREVRLEVLLKMTTVFLGELTHIWLHDSRTTPKQHIKAEELIAAIKAELEGTK